MKTLACTHKEDWMCEECCNCSVCCKCDSPPDVGIVHVNSLAAANAWRRSMHQGPRKGEVTVLPGQQEIPSSKK